MKATKMKKGISKTQLLPMVVVALLLAATAAFAAAPGISGTGTAGTFNLTAQAAYITQPDGQMVYSWGYGCVTGSSPSYLPSTITTTPTCNTMQVPGPTLIVTENQTVTVN